jgi:glycosyltransferase involved in cell wall biosynthesis
MLSVLMSVYSRENPEYLHDALQSLVIQTVQPNEIVLVKDGPLTPELDSVIDDYSHHLSLRVVELQENSGLAQALNSGLRFVSHPWVMRFDTDDICVKDRIEKQIAIIKEGKYDLFGAQIDEFKTDYHFPIRIRHVPYEYDDIVKYSLRRNPFNHMTVCFRKAIIQELGGYPNIAFMEDYALWLKMIAAGAKVCNLSEILVHVRIGNGMINRRGGSGYIRSEWKLQMLMYSLGMKSVFGVFLDGLARSLIFMSPVGLREFIYQSILRKKLNDM